LEEMHLSLSSDQYMVGVYENTCVANGDQCDVPSLYDWSNSKTHESLHTLINDEVEIFGHHQTLLLN